MHSGAGAIFCRLTIRNPLSQDSRMDQSLLASAPVSAGEIPVLDIGDYLANAPGSLEAVASQLRFALENIGFFYLIGHGVRQELIDHVFIETKRFHAQPLEDKLKVRLNRSNNGYMPLRGHAQRHTTLNKTPPKPNENESFFAKRERDPHHPSVSRGDGLTGRSWV